jgi:BirA family biotin operon repressor/biotin-[acetyl-CoA-carboxylase] ligase
MSIDNAQPVQTGHSIDAPIHVARQRALQAALGTTWTTDQITWLTQTSSTNDEVRQHLRNRPSLQQLVVVADQQYAGRGQSGRVWQSLQGQLYLSLLATLQTPIQGRLALEVALAVLDMPQLTGIVGLGVKWPNDLHHQASDGVSAKWGGILIEPDGMYQVIIGIGINAVPLLATDQPVTDLLSLSGQVMDLVTLASQATQALCHACTVFDAGSPQLVARFAQHDGLAGHTIRVQSAAHPEVVGVAQGIDANGALQVRTASGLQTFYQGHVRRDPHASSH